MVDTILALIQKGLWLPLIIMILTLVNSWLAPNSSVPINPSPALRAILIIVLGQGLGVLSAVAAHQPWQSLEVHAVLASIISIGASHAVFSNGAPAWMQMLAGIAQSIESTSATKNVAEAPKVDVPVVEASSKPEVK